MSGRRRDITAFSRRPSGRRRRTAVTVWGICPELGGGDLREEEEITTNFPERPGRRRGPSEFLFQFAVRGLKRQSADHRAVDAQVCQFPARQCAQLAHRGFVQLATCQLVARQFDRLANPFTKATLGDANVGCVCHSRSVFRRGSFVCGGLCCPLRCVYKYAYAAPAQWAKEQHRYAFGAYVWVIEFGAVWRLYRREKVTFVIWSEI